MSICVYFKENVNDFEKKKSFKEKKKKKEKKKETEISKWGCLKGEVYLIRRCCCIENQGVN